MTVAAKILVRTTVTDDADGECVIAETVSATIADVVGVSGKRETVALTAAFSALSPPTGSTCVMIRVTAGAVTLTLKGITGDTGIVLQSAALGTIPLVLPLGTSPSIGILSDGVATLEVIWL